MSLMPITKYVEADLSFITNVNRYNDKVDWFNYSYSFSENLCIIQKCNESGIPLTDWDKHTEYVACKLSGDFIMFMYSKEGWTVDITATEKYAHILADKELLK